ncbi:hypothetical protein AVEN_201364-1 [Araneus ventricosus]|uniref:Uncharacterized protein n=1 Tax=Araneus ventricosus TaxID=182803 RepID=A0A4Y2TGT6_ARAVE|nr:hypothetical protein AVEN_201364-1 [Araneus ventricosus]
MFVTFPDNCLPWLLNRCHTSLFNVVDTLTLEVQSVVNTSKIGEEDYNTVPIEFRDSTQASRLRSAENTDFLLFRKVDCQSLAAPLHLLQLTGILFDF